MLLSLDVVAQLEEAPAVRSTRFRVLSSDTAEASQIFHLSGVCELVPNLTGKDNPLSSLRNSLYRADSHLARVHHTPQKPDAWRIPKRD